MDGKEIRQTFLEFFKAKDHKIVASAPIVNKSDPTLMFTNAGMNQFKDYFLGNEQPASRRITDTQKCLRVSGKHNDLEEVGLDGYHHTMFEMLGNWSFGDYFKEETINWAWELLTDKLGVDPELLYATVFSGDEDDNLGVDEEAEEIWKKLLPTDRILRCGKKDNFWEMGETGPCGPCSEIHIDLRSSEDKARIPGAELVNADHPEVIEIWNLVFIQYNRSFGGDLTLLPEKHVDTGMGFERLCMVLQGKKSSYDTDVFTPFIKAIERTTGKKYGGTYSPDNKQDVAFRVVSDHLRAVVFAVADGQLPSNTGAGYVIRRILRRAVRYYFSFLDRKEPMMCELVDVMIAEMGHAFPELKDQATLLRKVVEEEEASFLRTLENGLVRLDQILSKTEVIDGESAFELYDTYGFPIDLTLLIAEEKGFEVDVKGFREALAEQKERSRADAKKEVEDWVVLHEGQGEFVGYDQLEVSDARILRYRPFRQKGKTRFQVVLDKNPFYAEGGGQIGDTGKLIGSDETIHVIDTQRENELFVLVTDKMFTTSQDSLQAVVDRNRRELIENNHSATHLLHAALREVLGDHVQQKGSLVKDDYLRFDFSHFSRMTDEEVLEVEKMVNQRIRENIAREEARSIPLEKAREAGAMMLFGEKYGDEVRMITFDSDYSRELCGGCHVERTGDIGLFKITTETSVASGIRRIEAVTSIFAEDYVLGEEQVLKNLKSYFKSGGNIELQVKDLIEENKALQDKITALQSEKSSGLKDEMASDFSSMKKGDLLIAQVDISDAKVAKDLIYQLEKTRDNAAILFGFIAGGKPQLMLRISESIANKESLNAGSIVKQLAANIKGGGGGQPFFATAGGGDPSGIDKALEEGKGILEQLLNN